MDKHASGRHLEIVVNGRPVVTTASTLAVLVERQMAADAPAGVKVATAVNGHFVAAALRATTLLQPGDRIEIVSPRQGG